MLSPADILITRRPQLLQPQNHENSRSLHGTQPSQSLPPLIPLIDPPVLSQSRATGKTASPRGTQKPHATHATTCILPLSSFFCVAHLMLIRLYVCDTVLVIFRGLCLFVLCLFCVPAILSCLSGVCIMLLYTFSSRESVDWLLHT